VPGHEYVVRLLEELRGAVGIHHEHHSHTEVRGEQQYPHPFFAKDPWSLHAVTTELPETSDAVSLAAHYRISKHTGMPHTLVLGKDAYFAVKSYVLWKYGKNSVLYNALASAKEVRDPRKGKLHYLVGLPHVVNGKVVEPVKYSPDRLPFDDPKKISELWRQMREDPSKILDVLEMEHSYKHVVQGGYTILDRNGPRYVGTSSLDPCVSVVVHDRKNGRTYVAHVDDFKHFSHWKETLLEMEKEAKGDYEIYFVGDNLRNPFVLKPKEFQNTRMEGFVNKRLADEIRNHLNDLKSKGVNIKNVGFLQARNFVFDRETGSFHPLEAGSTLERAQLYDERMREIKREWMKESGRRRLYHV
jgi:hypothetical protein